MQPLVSVIVPTYNHASYIKHTLDGINLQQTTFLIKVIIGNDCSTDNTEQICKNYIFTNPNIELLFFNNATNVGVIQNWKNILQHANTKYIAVCEGDDYWTNATKLAQQIELLESNSNIAICFHTATYFDDVTSSLLQHTSFNGLQITNITNLALCNYIDNLTVVCRNYALQNPYPTWVFSPSFLVPDYAWHLYNAQFGDIFFIQNNMANYRVRQNALWANKNTEYKTLHLLETLLPTIKANIDNKAVQKQIDFQALNIAETAGPQMMDIAMQFVHKQSIIAYYQQKLQTATALAATYKQSTSYKLGNAIIKPFNIFKK